MRLSNIFKMVIHPCPDELSRELYSVLMQKEESSKFRVSNHDENMSIAYGIRSDYWKPFFLLDHDTKHAYEFMDSDEVLSNISDDDIDWASLKNLPEVCLQRARWHYAHFPTNVRRFENGVAEVSWQLNPDGRYYMDDDGFGMTNDEEVAIYGFIDRTGKVVVKFQFINEDWKRLAEMRKEAEEIVKDRN